MHNDSKINTNRGKKMKIDLKQIIPEGYELCNPFQSHSYMKLALTTTDGMNWELAPSSPDDTTTLIHIELNIRPKQ